MNTSTAPATLIDYAAIGASIGELVNEKQAAYGDSFGKSGAILRILYPDGISLEQLDDALTVTRVVDKLFRIATDRDALGESPWRDVAGYALLSVARVEQGRAPGPASWEAAAKVCSDYAAACRKAEAGGEAFDPTTRVEEAERMAARFLAIAAAGATI